MVVRIGIDLPQICLFFFFFLLTRGWRISAGLNKSSSRSSIHLQSSDFPARRNDQTNLCDRDTSVEKVGRRLKSKFKSHPPPTRRPLVPRLFRFILQLMKHGGGMCVGALVPRTSCLLFSDNFRPRSFFFFLFPTKSRVKAALTAETDIRVFIAERIIYHGLWICTVDRITDYTRLPLLIARQCPVGWIRCTFGARERGMSEALFSEWRGEGWRVYGGEEVSRG